MFCRKLTWTCRKHYNDVARQVETPNKAMILSRDINYISYWRFCYIMTRKQVDTAIDALSEASQHAAPFAVL